MAIIGTAGHVDHGKSTLVEALTGTDPDRLEEEKRRGLTIDLGFAHLDLPGGVRVGIIDVPGHARFLNNMLAGVHGMDLVLLVVAADEGVMPQTREHLDIIRLLGVERILVVLTKVDLVEPAFVALVEADVREELDRRGIAAEMVRVAVPRGQPEHGIEELKAALSRALAGADHPDRGRPRLPVDRAFTIAGFGAVVTGSLVDGALRVGQEVELLPPLRGTHGRQHAARPLRARVRGLEQHGRQVEEAQPGSRVAVNLQGVDRQDIHRGQVLAPPGGMSVTLCVDARLTVLPSAHPLRHNQRVRVHTGTAQVAARLVLLDGDELASGATGWAQLRLASPVALREGDRLVLRRLSPAETLAGGIVADLSPRRHRRREPGVVASLEHRMEARGRLLEELRRASNGAIMDSLRSRLDDAPALEEELHNLVEAGDAVTTGMLYFSADSWSHVETAVHAAIAGHSRKHPLHIGMPREGLRQALHLEGRGLAEVIDALVARAVIEAPGPGLVALPGGRPQLSAVQEKAVAEVLARLGEEPLSPPRVSDLTELGLDDDLRQYLEDTGAVVRLAADMLILPGALAEARNRLHQYLEENGSTTVAAARDVLGSSRRTVVPLLEYFDATRMTRRDGDLRSLRGPAPQRASRP